MGMLQKITPVILTYNEEQNIKRTLSQLFWAKEVIVVDSFSTDSTREICRSFSNVKFLRREFDNHSSQWNYAVAETEIISDWILALDADFIVTKKLIDEIDALVPFPDTVAYFAKFDFAIHGRILPSALYPPVAVLFKKGKGFYIQDGHTQRLKWVGNVQALKNTIIIDDRKSISSWIVAQSKYARLEAEKIAKSRFKQLGWPDKVRKCLVFGPFIVFVYTLFVKGAILKGWHGFFYSFQRLGFEILLSLFLLEKKVVKFF